MANTLKFGNGEWYGKKDTILAYNDENDNYKPLLFDFSRNSSATVINKDGLIETVSSGQPRIDYKDDAKGALLLEPQRSNLIQYSEDFNQWTNQNAPTIVISSELAPNGVLDAYDITDENTGYGYIRSNSISFNGTYTGSIFIRKTLGALSHYAGLEICLAGSYLIINTTDGSINQTSNGYTNIKSEDFGDWWRVSATATNNSTGNILQFWPAISSNGTSISSFAQGTNTFWGAQVEQGSYATSYIPTSGSAVTRIGETCNNGANEQVINSTEGVLYAEISALGEDNVYRIFSVSNGTTQNRLSLGYTNNNQLFFGADGGGNYEFEIESNAIITDNNKIALRYNSDNITLFLNGIKTIEEPNGVSFDDFTKLNFNGGNGSQPFNGKTKELQVFTTVLSDEELIELTTIS